MSIIGDNIRKRREELGYTQEELAKKLGYKSKSTINKIELGINDISQTKIIAFADALEIPPSLLMGWEDENLKLSSKDKVLFDLKHILSEYTQEMLECIGNVLKVKRIELDLTEKRVSELSKLELDDYLDIEVYHRNIGEEKILQVIEALEIDSYYFIGLLSGLKILLNAMGENKISDKAKETIINTLFKKYY